MNPTSDLPNCFPIGTRYIIESHGGRVVARFVEFPDGRRLNLTAAGSLRRKERRTAREGRASARLSGRAAPAVEPNAGLRCLFARGT